MTIFKGLLITLTIVMLVFRGGGIKWTEQTGKLESKHRWIVPGGRTNILEILQKCFSRGKEINKVKE